MNGLKINTKLKKYYKNVWAFPLFLFLVLLLLALFRISGTSIGIYNQIFSGPESKDSKLLIGKPQSIRSDEWLVNTQAIIAQDEADYPRINENYGESRDMSVLADVPYKEWSVIFKPQNIIFLMLPLEFAFAFKWWLLLFLLIISCYFFCLRMFKNNVLLSAIFALGFSFSPFIFWWYQTATIAPLFYGFFIMLLGMRIIDGKHWPKISSKIINDAISVALLTFLLTAFGLIMYPPFQIPIALIVATYLLGYSLNRYFDDKRKLLTLVKKLLIFVTGIVLAGIIIGIFIGTRWDAIKSASETIYPGKRVVSSGGIEPLQLLNSFVQPQLQSKAGQNFISNQSESSNFILLVPFLFLPSLLLMLYEYREKHKVDWIFLSINIGVLILLARVLIPFGQPIYKLLFLHLVPHERLIIGLGFIGFIQLLLFLRKMTDYKLKSTAISLGYSVCCFITLLIIGSSIQSKYPLFIVSDLRLLLACLGFTVIIFLVVSGRALLAGLSLCFFSLASVVLIHPLYVGLGIPDKSNIIDNIKRFSSEDSTWVTADTTLLQNFGLLADRNSLTGVYFYPDVEYWRQFGGDQADKITNRYAHTIFFSDQSRQEPIILLQPDVFAVKLACSDVVKENVDYVLSLNELPLNCLDKIETTKFPAQNVHYYKINNN